MRKWYIAPDKTQQVGVLLYPKYSNHCLANAVEPLRAANTLSGKTLYSWHVLTLDGGAVRSSSGLPIRPEGALQKSAGGDFLFVLPSYDFRNYITAENTRALRAAARKFDTLVGMDTGSWLLAEAGLLDGYRATIHWDEITRFGEAFPEVEAVEDRFVRDRQRITCGGAMTSFDLVLDMIGRTHGQSLRLEVAALFMHGTKRPPDPMARRSGSVVVDGAVSIMLANLETPLTLPEIAVACAVSQRKLQALFRSHMGATPRSVYKRFRLTAARRYVLQSDYRISEIALRCGYENAAAMTRAFSAEFATTPQRLRRDGT